MSILREMAHAHYLHFCLLFFYVTQNVNKIISSTLCFNFKFGCKGKQKYMFLPTKWNYFHHWYTSRGRPTRMCDWIMCFIFNPLPIFGMVGRYDGTVITIWGYGTQNNGQEWSAISLKCLTGSENVIHLIEWQTHWLNVDSFFLIFLSANWLR